jgi:hypothetical protein
MTTPPTSESIERDREGAAGASQNVADVITTITETARGVGDIANTMASGTTTGASGGGEAVNSACGVADALSSGVGAAASSSAADAGIGDVDCGGCDCGCNCVIS